METLKKIKALASVNANELIEIREYFHKNPELSFKEKETARFISLKLNEYGIPHTTGIANTGILGIIEGNNPLKRVIALRADMDALPIMETNKVLIRNFLSWLLVLFPWILFFVIIGILMLNM